MSYGKQIKDLTCNLIKEGEYRGIALVVERNQSVPNVLVRFYLDGEAVGDPATTDDEGMARIEFQTSKEGTSELKAKISGEAAIRKISFTSTKKSEKKVFEIIMEEPTVRTGDTVKYTFWAVGEDKKPIPHQKFEVTDRGTGEKHKIVGGKDGKATYSCNYYSSVAPRTIIFEGGGKEMSTHLHGGKK